MADDKIGLFPLKIVLLPDALLSFHIFEDKFKKLIKECWQNKKPFGINLKISTKIYDIGCTADINEITKFYDDGRMDIIISGIKRYKLIEYGKSESGYLSAEIEYLDDLKEEINSTVVDKCIEIYNQIAESVNTIHIEKIYRTDLSKKYPSFILAQKSGLDIAQRQFFLEMNSENERLYYLLDHFNKILPMIKETEFISRIQKNDGYFYRK